MRNGAKRKDKIRQRVRDTQPRGLSDRSLVVTAGEATLAEQAVGVHSCLTYGSDANVRSLVSSTLVPLVYQGGVVNAGVIRFLPGDFLSPDCIANIWGGASLNSAQGDDSAAQLLIEPGDQYSVTGVSVEFIPEVVFLDRGGSFVITRFAREITQEDGITWNIEDLLPALGDTNAWPLEAAASAGVYIQELENTNRFEFGEFTLPVFPLDPENGHMFTARVPPGTAYPSAAASAGAFLNSPEFLSKVRAWGLMQIEYIAPAGMPTDNAVVGHFRIRRSIQEIYVPSPEYPVSFTLAAGIAPAIVLPDEVKEGLYAREADLAVTNTPVRGANSFQKAISWLGKAMEGALETAGGLAVSVQSALSKGVKYVRDNPETAEMAVQAAAMLLSRGRAGKMPGVPKKMPLMLKM